MLRTEACSVFDPSMERRLQLSPSRHIAYASFVAENPAQALGC